VELEDLAAALGLTDDLDVLRVGWESSRRAMPARLFFLAPDFVAEACRATYLPEDVAREAADAARQIANDAPLRTLAWHYHHGIYVSGLYVWDNIVRWPSLEASRGDVAGMFYLLVMLSGLPTMRAVHRAHRVPEEVARETILDLRLWLDEERARAGKWTVRPLNVAWLANHFRGELYRLGRLQFQFAAFWAKVRAYRHATSGAVVALSEDGVRYTADGWQQAGEGESEGVWTACLVEGRDAVTGNPIAPTGRALQQAVTLPTCEWRQALAPGDPVINIHIPAGEPLDHAACGRSFCAARGFFARHFPERPFAAYCCGSWLLDAQLEGMLPPTSNIVRFQREFYLIPIRLWTPTMLERVFGRVPEDLSQAPRDTALRRAILDVLESGRQLRPAAGGGFILPDDLRWGTQVYRSQRMPWD